MGVGIQCGIVGLPNVGKSTLFNALTAGEIAAENYPFCTIEPNVGVALVPDPRLYAIAAISKPKEVIPTAIEFVDIAGLVAGASRGEGLGNKFLGHIRDVDAVAHVVRCFVDPNVAHVTAEIDPVGDMEVINTELALADLEAVEKGIDRYGRRAKAGDKETEPVVRVLERLRDHLATGMPARSLGLTTEERRRIREFQLLTLKPTIYVANVDEAGTHGTNPLVERVRERAAAEGSDLVVICASIEAEIAQLDPGDKTEFLADLEQTEPGLDRVIHAAYHLLDLQTFFTTGDTASRAWTCAVGATAPEAAGRIHTDFQKGFIRAEVIAYEDFVAHGGEAGAKEAGKWRLEGRDYVVADGDVIFFRFNV
jgi:ribosome-binding ATPase